jgi:hypothetical protein
MKQSTLQFEIKYLQNCFKNWLTRPPSINNIFTCFVLQEVLLLGVDFCVAKREPLINYMYIGQLLILSVIGESTNIVLLNGPCCLLHSNRLAHDVLKLFLLSCLLIRKYLLNDLVYEIIGNLILFSYFLEKLVVKGINHI